MRPTAAIPRLDIRSARRSAGVTLIELIVVITITGILAVVLGSFIVQPIEGFRAMSRRAELVDAAEMAMRQTARDIRQALPNSVRIDPTGRVIEMLSTLDGARYRQRPGTVPGGHAHPPNQQQYQLQIPGNDANGFNVVGFFRNIAVPFDSSAQNPPARLAIYNQGNAVADAYADGDESIAIPPPNYVITRNDVTRFTIDNDDGLPVADEHHVALTFGTFRFRLDSDTNRVFIVGTPITYICNPAAGTITRYWNYPIRTNQPTNPAASPLNDAGAQNAVLTRPVTACAFRYTAGTNTRSGIVTLDITVRDIESNEQVRLLHQVHVDNSP